MSPHKFSEKSKHVSGLEFSFFFFKKNFKLERKTYLCLRILRSTNAYNILELIWHSQNIYHRSHISTQQSFYFKIFDKLRIFFLVVAIKTTGGYSIRLLTNYRLHGRPAKKQNVDSYQDSGCFVTNNCYVFY